MVRDRDREKGRDDEEEKEKGQLRSRLEMVKALVCSLGTGQHGWMVGNSGQVTYETSKEYKNTRVDWRHMVESKFLAQGTRRVQDGRKCNGRGKKSSAPQYI